MQSIIYIAKDETFKYILEVFYMHPNEELRELAYRKAKNIYGKKLPGKVLERLERELIFIIENELSSVYLTLSYLVERNSLKHFEWCVRGIGWNSFVAYLCGFTPLNPLPPHYVCIHDKVSDFLVKNARMSCQLPDRECPICGSKMSKLGESLPQELYMPKAVYKGKGKHKIQIDVGHNNLNEIESSLEEISNEFGDCFLKKDYYIWEITPFAIFDFIKALYKSTNVSPESIDIEAEDVINVFRNRESIGLSYSTYRGYPLGTRGVIDGDDLLDLLLISKPKSFNDLIHVKGIYHSTGLLTSGQWEKLSSKQISISNMITSVEDFYETMIDCGISKKDALLNAELLRRGKDIDSNIISVFFDKLEESDEVNLKDQVFNAEYVFPRAWIIYLTMRLYWLAYYKFNFPNEFYNEYFRIFASDSEMEVISGGWKCIKKQLNAMDYKLENRSKINTFELAIEMIERQMMQVDTNKIWLYYHGNKF